MLHTFEKSVKTETKYSHLHDKIYQEAFNKIASQSFVLDKIDRDICDYDTFSGKKLQQSDVDTLLFFTGPQRVGCKKISEKVRNSSYNDLYLEVISVLMEHKGNYYVDSLGWSNKDICNPNNELSPDYLSYICLNNKNNTYKSLFITGYKELKRKLFFNSDAELSKIINSDFINILANKIKEKEEKNIDSFSIRTLNKLYDNIIVAKNRSEDTGTIYYTIGITISLEKIKKLNIKMSETTGTINFNIKNKF